MLFAPCSANASEPRNPDNLPGDSSFELLKRSKSLDADLMLTDLLIAPKARGLQKPFIISLYAHIHSNFLLHAQSSGILSSPIGAWFEPNIGEHSMNLYNKDIYGRTGYYGCVWIQYHMVRSACMAD